MNLNPKSNPKSNLSIDQSTAWEKLQSSDNVFITGEAGSGKSYIIRQFMKDKHPKLFPVLASTGAAAVLIGGRTFHSFMGLGIMEGGPEATLKRALEDRRVKKRIKDAEGVVIDEVSMLSGPTLQVAESICRRIRGVDLPWGGLRIVTVGDFSQLPPVEKNSDSKNWAFLNPVWKMTQFQSVVLRQNMRTEHGVFLKILNHVRLGQVTSEVKDFLNHRLHPEGEDFQGTRLFPRRYQTDSFNKKELHKLEGELYVFPTQYSGNDRSIQQLKKHSPLTDEIHLKLGAFVMLRHNDPKQRWVNGSTGFVKSISEEELSIELLTGRTIQVEPMSFSLHNAEGVPMASAENFPISLAYATTIHKAQGMTLDRLIVNLSNLWEPGQAYVALSRVTDPDNLYLESWQSRSIKSDPLVSRFYNQLMKNEAMSEESSMVQNQDGLGLQ